MVFVIRLLSTLTVRIICFILVWLTLSLILVFPFSAKCRYAYVYISIPLTNKRLPCYHDLFYVVKKQPQVKNPWLSG